MKTFLFSIAALALMIAVILCNSAYVKSITNEMESELKALTPCAQAPAEALLDRWYEEQTLLQLSVSTTDMTEIENHLTELCTAAQTNDKEAFERARALCLCGIARVRDLERFSLLHIL